MKNIAQRTWLRLAVLASGTTFFLEGCDTSTRAAVEDGIITSSSSLLGAFMRAVIELAEEAGTTSAAAVAALQSGLA